ncbi:unnamed protein product [Fraxinus pennsylvanica]|uniref:Pentatricopeptide repeat-containing protein n=1 Tax=Fraxinus pennsylvanica TaxID=56036 RepID=A0AAD1YVU5_9LAMI|nr:unnamed protein product [Fraxinus pennsylvanica]
MLRPRHGIPSIQALAFFNWATLPSELFEISPLLVEAYNKMIDLSGKGKDREEAIKVLNTMVKKGCEPNPSSFNPILRCIAEAQDVSASGVKLILISVYCKMGQCYNAYKNLKEMVEEKRSRPGVPACKMVLEQLRKAGGHLLITANHLVCFVNMLQNARPARNMDCLQIWSKPNYRRPLFPNCGQEINVLNAQMHVEIGLSILSSSVIAMGMHVKIFRSE